MTTDKNRVMTIENREDMKDAIKPIFYLLTGKPDNLLKIYNRNVIITPECIKELNDLIHEKLDHFELNGLVFTATVSYQNNKSVEFGSWNEFELNKWNIPDRTKSIMIKWDFLVKLPEYGSPQRHSITLRIAQGTTEKELLMLMLNNNLEELDNIDINTSPMFCRVDFINTLLGTEILEMVERWNKSRKSPKKHGKLSSFLYKKRRLIARTIEYSFPVLVFMLILSSINFMTTRYQFDSLTSEAIKPYLFWLVISSILLMSCKRISFILARIFFNSIGESRQYNIFELTNGDINRKQEIIQSTKEQRNQVILSVSMSFIMNITTGLISAYLFRMFD